MSERDDFGGRIVNWLAAVVLVVGLLAFTVPNFVRARSIPSKNICINNLRQIAAAKQQWALENEKPPSAISTQNDVVPYLKSNHPWYIYVLKNNVLPACPAGGRYILGRADEKPRCTIGGPGHTLPEP